MPWASSSGSDFNFDFGVSFTKEQQQGGSIEYNYRSFDPAPLLRYLERTGGRVVQVEQNRYYALGPLEQMVRRLEGVMAGGAERSPAELRELLGLSRKYLIPFLEYCDRVGHTHRTAGGRVWNGVVNRDGPVK